MPVFGAVLTLDPGGARLPDDGRLTLGEPAGNRLPVVLETVARGEDDAVWAALRDAPGVLGVDIAFVDFSDLVEVHP